MSTFRASHPGQTHLDGLVDLFEYGNSGAIDDLDNLTGKDGRESDLAVVRSKFALKMIVM